MFNHYSGWVWCWGVQFDFVRDLASKLPSAISEFTAYMSGDQLDSDIVIGSGHDLRPETQLFVSVK